MLIWCCLKKVVKKGARALPISPVPIYIPTPILRTGVAKSSYTNTCKMANIKQLLVLIIAAKMVSKILDFIKNETRHNTFPIIMNIIVKVFLFKCVII